MTFIEMRDLLNEHFEKMTKNVEKLFVVGVDKDEMWNLYLDSFPKGTNEIYRERREYDCSCCRGFIKNIGNVVRIQNGEIETVWDFKTNDEVFAPVLKAMSNYIKSHTVSDVYMSIENKIGCHHNFEMLENVGPKQWDHFFLTLPERYMCINALTKNEKLNDYRTSRNVFKRSLDEITLDAVETVLDLVITNTLYKGDEWKSALITFKNHKIAYDNLTSDSEKELYAWEHSVTLTGNISKIRNTSMGTLLVDLSEGKSLDNAVKAYESITAPSNYKRSKPLFTQKMLDDAQDKIYEMGYTASLPRRYANFHDITVNDILYSDRTVAMKIKGAEDIFGELAKRTKNNPKKFSKVEEISVDDFINNVIPTVSSIEAYVENKHVGNMVSLIAPVNSNVKSMFKWGNNFTWAYSGNMTDSMKQRVKALGGKIDGDLRFSIQWNEEGTDNCDLDAHCIEPNGFDLGFDSAKKPHYSPTRGQLDVDIINPNYNVAVENITWNSRTTMRPGTYRFYVRQFSGSVRNGFRAEIEFDGNVYSFDYPDSIRTHQEVDVAEVTLNNNGEFTIKPILNSNTTSREVWGITTNEFTPVTVICHSPNHWSTAENQTGHKHIFFMLKDCINEENPSGIFNEFLVPELYKHRHVMEAIGERMRVENSTDQLSGLGFALDKRNELVVKVKGATERVLKIKF